MTKDTPTRLIETSEDEKALEALLDEVADMVRALPALEIRDIPEELAPIFGRDNLVETATQSVATILALHK